MQDVSMPRVRIAILILLILFTKKFGIVNKSDMKKKL